MDELIKKFERFYIFLYFIKDNLKGYKSFFNVDWKFFRVVVLNYRNLLNVFFVRIVLDFMFFLLYV